MKTYHLLPSEPGWKLTLTGFEDAIEDYASRTKEEALEHAVNLIEGEQEPASLHIHQQDGSVEEERTYPRSADPEKSPG